MKKYLYVLVLFLIFFTTLKADPFKVRILSGDIDEDIVIEVDNFVLIKNTIVTVTPGHKIVIKKGGVLRIVNSVVTVHDDPNGTNYGLNSFWNGIVIEGDPNADQADMHKLYCTNKYETCINEEDQENIECFIPYATQGALYMTNSTIKYAKRAIGVGNYSDRDFYNDYTDESKSGGYLYLNNSKFINCVYSICFAPYKSKNYYQMSKIKNCWFEARFTAGGVKADITNPIVIYSNNFKHTFESNTIVKNLNSKGRTPNIGMLLSNTQMEIVDCTFGGSSFQPILWGMYSPSISIRPKLINCKFIDIDLQGIDIEGVDQLICEKNGVIHYNNAYKTLNSSPGNYWYYTAGQYGFNLSGANNARFRKNVFKNYNSSNKYAINNGLIFNTHQGQSTLILNNEFNQAVHAIDFSYDQTKTLWNCNLLSKSKKLDAHLTSGVAFTNLGSYSNPLSNTFTASLNPNLSSDNSISNFYFFNGVNNNYSPKIGINMAKRQGISISDPCPYIEDVSTYLKDMCGNVIYNNKDYKFYTYNGLKNSYLTSRGDTNIANKEASEILFDDYLGDLIDIFQVTDSVFLPENNIDSILYYCHRHPTLNGRYYELFFSIDAGRTDSIENIIDSIEVNYPGNKKAEDIVAYARLIKEYKEADYRDTWLYNHFDTFFYNGRRRQQFYATKSP